MKENRSKFSIKIIFIIIMAMIFIPVSFYVRQTELKRLSESPKYHYDVRKDLSVYFSNADSVIETLRDSLHNHYRKITVTYTSHSNNMDDISDIVRELMRYAVDETDDPTEGDYIYHQYGGYALSYKYSAADGIYKYNLTIMPNYYTTLKQEAQVSEKIGEIIDSFGFDSNTSDYEKFREIYDYIYNNVEYDKIHKKNENYHLKTTAYAALFHGQAVCQGYAVLMYRMLREVGIDTRVITGWAEYEHGSELHAWNIVKLDGEYYNVDITWDKQSETDKYFLKCDRNFDLHERDDEYKTEEFYEKYPMADFDYNYK